MNLLAAIRSVHIRDDIPEPESMTDHWRNRPVAESDCNCKKCTGGSNPYGDESCDSYQRTSLAELMELAWKEHEDMLWRQTQKVWRQYEEAPAVIEKNPEVTTIAPRVTSARPSHQEISDARKKARATRRRNTKRLQRRRLELLKNLAFGVDMLKVDVELEFSSTESAERTLYVPLHLLDFLAGTIANKLKKDYHFTGPFRIVRMTPHKLEGKPWQAAHMSAKDLDYDHDYTEEERRSCAELHFQTVAVAHDLA